MDGRPVASSFGEIHAVVRRSTWPPPALLTAKLLVGWHGLFNVRLAKALE